MSFSGNFAEKNDPQTELLGFSIYLSDTVRHFKNVQNTHNSGHISQNNTKNNNFYNNNNYYENNNQTKYKKNLEKINQNDESQKNKNKDKNNNKNEINIENFVDEKTIKIPIIFGTNEAFRVLGIKEYILEIRKDIENLWKSYEINNFKNSTDNEFFPCFSTISVSNAPSSSTSFSTSTTSSNSAESLKVKIFLRTRADGPTKVRNIFV